MARELLLGGLTIMALGCAVCNADDSAFTILFDPAWKRDPDLAAYLAGREPEGRRAGPAKRPTVFHSATEIAQFYGAAEARVVYGTGVDDVQGVSRFLLQIGVPRYTTVTATDAGAYLVDRQTGRTQSPAKWNEVAVAMPFQLWYRTSASDEWESIVQGLVKEVGRGSERQGDFVVRDSFEAQTRSLRGATGMGLAIAQAEISAHLCSKIAGVRMIRPEYDSRPRLGGGPSKELRGPGDRYIKLSAPLGLGARLASAEPIRRLISRDRTNVKLKLRNPYDFAIRGAYRAWCDEDREYGVSVNKAIGESSAFVLEPLDESVVEIALPPPPAKRTVCFSIRIIELSQRTALAKPRDNP